LVHIVCKLIITLRIESNNYLEIQNEKIEYVCILMTDIKYNFVSDQHILELLHTHKDELQLKHKIWLKNPNIRHGYHTYHPEWLPNYIIKYGVERTVNAQKVENTIHTLNLDLLAVPPKYIFRLYGDVEAPISNLNSVVVSQFISGKYGDGSFIMDVEQTRQLAELAINVFHYDIHRQNLIKSGSDSKIYIIDTDHIAMPPQEKHEKLYTDWLENGIRIQNINVNTLINPEIINDPLTRMEISMYSKVENYTEEARNYLKKLIYEREQYRLNLKN
jgi:hypothetical protein